MAMTKKAMAAARGVRQAGMTLIEILVAIVVLSIGLLGLAGLQLKGLQVNQGSSYRWQAAMLAEDLADRIRADKPGAIAGYYTLPASASSASGAGTTAALNEWLARVAALPGGTATVAAAGGGAPTGEMVIQVFWDDTRGNNGVGNGSTNPPGNFTLNTALYN